MKRTLLIATAVCALAGAGFAVASLSALKTVNIRSTGFVPRNVTIAGGDTVRWKNVDTVRHQVVANNGAFASGQFPRNGIYAQGMDTPGTYPYHDALHPALKGTVKVTGPPPSVSIGASVPIAILRRRHPRRRGNLHARRRRHGQLVRAALGPDVVREGRRRHDDHERILGLCIGYSPKLLTSYKATWKGKESATVQVAVSPRLTLTRSGGRFVARAQAAKSFAATGSTCSD